MEEEIISTGEITSIDGKQYILAYISNEGLSQINKIILGDEPDEGSPAEELREQVHEDCLRLFAEFN